MADAFERDPSTAGPAIAERIGPRWSRAARFDARGRLIILIGALSIVVAEGLTLGGDLGAAALGHAIATVLLLVIALVGPTRPVRRLSMALVTVPILRLLSISIPVVLIPPLAWYVEIGLPAFLAILLAARALELRPVDLGLRSMPWGDLAAFGLAGAALGVPAYLIGQPGQLIDLPSPGALLAAAVIMIVFVALLEELLLRGLIQSVATETFARGGVLVSIAATVLLYAASLNVRYVLFMSLVAALLSVSVRQFGSIAGAVAAHGALVCVQLVILPLLFS